MPPAIESHSKQGIVEPHLDLKLLKTELFTRRYNVDRQLKRIVVVAFRVRA